jgi:hypothetical protein
MTGGLLELAGLSAVTRQHLRLALGDFRKATLKGFNDRGMKHPPWLAQQCAISCVLNQGVLEKIACVWRYALPEEQPGCDDAVKRGSELCLRLAYDRSQQSM